MVNIPRPAESALEAAFRLQLMELRQRVPSIPPWERNLLFIHGRKKQLDFAWSAILFGIEVDGGAHATKERFHGDREKQALALLHGWRILPVTKVHIHDGRAIAWAETLLKRYLAADLEREHGVPA